MTVKYNILSDVEQKMYNIAEKNLPTLLKANNIDINFKVAATYVGAVGIYSCNNKMCISFNESNDSSKNLELKYTSILERNEHVFFCPILILRTGKKFSVL